MLLSVKDLDVCYGVIHAIKSISFDVDEGEIVTLIGANGAGKSTTLKAISGMHPIKNGAVEFGGKSIVGMPSYKLISMGVSHVPEGRRIFSSMTVEENLDMGGYIAPPSEIKKRRDEVFERFPRLLERRKQTAGTLSGGEQQMLAIGRALMAQPKLIMLDEPSMGLAPILVEQIFSIIKELNSHGTTILLVEQNARMALTIANRGYVLETGKIVLSDYADKLLTLDSVKKAYLGG